MPKAPPNQPAREVALGTAHAASLFGCDPSTLRNYVERGIVAPLTSSSGRRMWRMADLLAIAAYRRERGLPDGGALVGDERER